MTKPLTFAGGHRDRVAVFAVNLPEPDAETADPETLLGVGPVDATRVELFPLRDLQGVGLPAYLTDGLGLDEDAVKADKARLTALEGHVLILHAAAFAQLPVTVSQGPNLTLIGTYDPPRPSLPLTPLRSASAQGAIGAAGGAQPAPGLRLGPLLIALAGLALLAGLAIVVAVLRAGNG